MSKPSSSRPQIIRLESSLKSLFKTNKQLIFVDAFDRQIKELFFIDNKMFIGRNKDEVYKSKEYENYKNKNSKNYCYVYYPWNGHVVKCIKEKDYFRLKTNRNRDLVTELEQQKLLSFKIAVLGMSVGSNIAFVLTQAGISKEIILADYDELDTTNLNRIWAGVHQVGLNKAIVAARRIYEDNPYAKVTILEKGITPQKLDTLLKNRKIDLIVEEIDSLAMKIEVRKLARDHKIPVLMVTDNGDGVILHVERYDLGYKQLFNKNFNYWKKTISNIKSVNDIGNLIMEEIIGGVKNADKRVLLSVNKVIKRQLVSWSQLGTAALYGGVVSTVIIKDIVLKRSKSEYIFRVLRPF
jgi:molybdopterin/thiamine biosynthesis adenylyltransferase